MKRLRSCRHGFMTLNAELIERRVKSAREFAGLSQRELGELMKSDGFGLHDVGKWERQDSTAPPLTRPRASSLAFHTGLPIEWFQEEDLAKILVRESDVNRPASSYGDQIADLAEAISERLADPKSPALDDLIRRLRSTGQQPPEERDEGQDSSHE